MVLPMEPRPRVLRRRQSSYCADRFIPVRSAMDMGTACFLLRHDARKKDKDDAAVVSQSRRAYRKLVADCLLGDTTRILRFNDRVAPPPTARFLNLDSCVLPSRSPPPVERCRHVPQNSVRVLDLPDLVDDFYLNLLDWGSENVVAVALGDAVYLWDDSKKSAAKLMSVDASDGPVKSVSWAADGKHLAVGLSNSVVQIWDAASCRLKRELTGMHRFGVGALSWNNVILTSAGMDGLIVNSDVRVRSHVAKIYRGHRQEVCGLKWADSGMRLASGGRDNLLHIWDISMASSSRALNQNQWLHRFDGHTDGVKALDWCPFQGNLLASGGGGCIKFWNTQTGTLLDSVDTGSQITGLLWNKNERELLSSHALEQNQLILWRYPSMTKMAELNGHTSQALFMARSPDACTVASAAADEHLRFWDVFGHHSEPKPIPKFASLGPFPNFNQIR